MHVKSTGLIYRSISLAAELAALARTLVADGLRFVTLLARPDLALAAENSFLGKDPACCEELTKRRGQLAIRKSLRPRTC